MKKCVTSGMDERCSKLIVACLMVCCICVSGCAVVKSTVKYEFKESTYNTRFLGGKYDRVYVVPQGDTTLIYPVARFGGRLVADTNHTTRLYPDATGAARKRSFYKPSFDVDVLTVLFKYRPQSGDFPRQLNTSFNGALYAGYRTDMYQLTRRRSPIGQERYHVNHFGFSLGGFAGLGSTAMNPWVTQYNITSEYDGLVVSGGLALVIGVNNLTAGIGLGADHLTDENRGYWIYQHKPWVSILFGLNLN